MSKIKTFISTALAALGKPYEYGSTGPDSFDCSGLVIAAAGSIGFKKIPRTAKEQAAYCKTITRSELNPGDLIFFDFNTPPQNIAHVGIYTGDGKMINAQSQSPAEVAQVSIDVGYWKNRIISYGRLFSDDDGEVVKTEIVASANTANDVSKKPVVSTAKPKHVLM